MANTNLFAYCKNNPLMYTDIGGNAPTWWQWVVSGSMVAAGIVLTATGVGGLLGGALIAGGVNSLLSGYINEALGGSYTAGWAGGMITGILAGSGAGIGGMYLIKASASCGSAAIAYLLNGIGISYAFGFAGSFAGSAITTRMDSVPFDYGNSLIQANLTGLTTILGSVGAGITNATMQAGSSAPYIGLGLGTALTTELLCDTVPVLPSFTNGTFNRDVWNSSWWRG